MIRPSTLLALALTSTVALHAGFAAADDADKAACADKEEGDECTRGDGDPGFCEWDDSDAVLSCDDDGPSSGNTGVSGCSASGASPDAWGALALALGALAVGRRRRG